jgi:NAD(P)-dependent dehydrogenase (short-subunit alcohol dehydrogenase family)
MSCGGWSGGEIEKVGADGDMNRELHDDTRLHSRERRERRSGEQELRASTPNRDLDFLQADLARVAESSRRAEELRWRWPALHYLVHSAGIVQGRRGVTAEGVEANFAVNYLSRFALTRQLLRVLAATWPARRGRPIRQRRGTAGSISTT